MISEKLVAAMYGSRVIDLCMPDNKTFFIQFRDGSTGSFGDMKTLSTADMAKKCVEWASSLGYSIVSNAKTNCYDGNSTLVKTENRSGVKAVFKIAEWILSQQNSLFGLVVDGNFKVVPGNEHCSTLVLADGDPGKLSDRIAFIEKTPRVLHNGEWVCGPKGSSDYGMDESSRQWVLDYLEKNDAIVIFD